MSWRLADYLDVLSVLDGHNFVYFTSEKSCIVELCEWMGRNPSLGNPFARCHKREFEATMNYNARYTDIMLYTAPAPPRDNAAWAHFLAAQASSRQLAHISQESRHPIWVTALLRRDTALWGRRIVEDYSTGIIFR